ncbi:hypothetical protein D9M73_245670 [compost metagenome]
MPAWVVSFPFCVLVVTNARGARARLPSGNDTDRLSWVSCPEGPEFPSSLVRLTSRL